MKKIIYPIIGIVLFGIFFLQCEKDSSKSSGYIRTDTTNNDDDDDDIIIDENTLTDNLDVPYGNIVDGDMPAPTNTASSPDLIMVDSTVSYSSGSQVRLPISFQDNSSSGISGVRFQVDGASKHVDINSNYLKSGSSILLPIGIPSDMESGKFCISITIYDGDGNVSNIYNTCITVTEPKGCGVQIISGGEGITSTLHNMGSNPGVVKIEYETYTVPDRIDVFYNGIWVAGTGTNPGELGTMPPLADCNNPTDGYIGENGVFCFDYNPFDFKKRITKKNALKTTNILTDFYESNSDNYVEVVVSGCMRGGTAWKYEISCADSSDECMKGQEGSPRFNLQFDGDVDFDLHVVDPNGEEIYWDNPYSSSNGQLDVDCICCEHGNENIFWLSGTAPTGQYEYWVEFYSACLDNTSNYTITITKNGNVVETKTGSLSTIKEESTHWSISYP